MFKHVLNTRLPPALPRKRSRFDVHLADCSRRLVYQVDPMRPIAAQRRRPANPIPESEPLPPEDRAVLKPMLSFDALYRGRKAKLLNFLRRHVPPENADDLLQTLFMRILTLGGDRMAAIDCPEAYLQRSARNLARDDARMAYRRPTHLQLWDGEEDLLPAADPIAGLEARDMLYRIEKAMLRLRPLTREIFMAHRLDGYTYAQIAQRTGLSIKGVEKQMSRAIAHLDRLLTER